MNLAIVRVISSGDEEAILKMPSYAKSNSILLLGDNDVILVAERNGVVCGAVSVRQKDISYVSGKWRSGFEQDLDKVTRHVSGGWISKLYVFPEYRNNGLGTMLVNEAVARLKHLGYGDAYAGVYVNNQFRKVSKDIFKKNGFRRAGYCICPLEKGYCQGVLLRKIVASDGMGLP